MMVRAILGASLDLRLAQWVLLLLLLTLLACREEPTPTVTTEPSPTSTTELAPAAIVAPTATTAATIAPQPVSTFDNLHVSSPVWQDQIIYFLMIDRFNDGDPGNNDQGGGEYDPADHRKFSGGDLQGIIDQLDYIQGLGATAIWITPPVANQWWDPMVDFGGYHGYWAEDFMAVDAHFGDLTTYQALSDALHDRSMYLIQDIVANHTGNFFTFRDENGEPAYKPEDPAAFFQINDVSVPVTEPSQSPFDVNNATVPEERQAAIYHWTPSIVNFDDEEQLQEYQLADLDDLNTDNPVVRDALRESYGYWIETVGVDGFRIDTVRHVEHDFWHDFVHGDDPEAPGINMVAAATGRDDFLTFGEAFIGSDPFSDSGDRQVASYLGTPEEPELKAVLNFPMHFTINRVFAEGQPTAYMTYRLNAAQDIFPAPAVIPVFIDNHDVTRFLAKGSVDGLKQATLFLMTTPGIPVIYYGTEQGFAEQRASMFAGGFGSDGVDHFDPAADLYQHIATVAELRKGNPIFSRGSVTVLEDNTIGPGVLAYKREYQGETAFVIFNTSDRPVLLTDLDTGLPAGTVLDLLFGLDNAEDLIVGSGGRMTLELATREGMVLLATDEVIDVGETEASVVVGTMLEDQTFTQPFTLGGTVSTAGTPLKLILNGNLGQAIDFTASDDGTWSVTVPIDGFAPGHRTNALAVYAPELGVASETHQFGTDIAAVGPGVNNYDVAGDDVGPLHEYTLPTDETFGDQMDILKTRVTAFGNNLQVELTMAETTDVWGPVNGFDHVLFQIFIDLPGQEGMTVLPRLNAEAPEGFAWDYMAFIEGWNNRLFSTEGAAADAFGAAVIPAPEISVNRETQTITFLFLADALGNPETLEGARVYVATWDWNGPDADYRSMRPTAGQWVFGGGDWTTDPLILDDTDVIPVARDERWVQGDPSGDDAGPYGPLTYTLPTEISARSILDLRHAAVIPQDDGSLRLSLTMGDLLAAPESANGFAQAAFHLFLHVPGQENGATTLPGLNAEAPAGVSWEYLVRITGQETRFSTAEGAAAGPPPDVVVDPEAKVIDVIFPVGALGRPPSWDGITVYATTWAWDDDADEYFDLAGENGPTTFGGGDPAADPLIADDVLLGAPRPYVSSVPSAPKSDITFLITVPDSTPEQADLYLTGPFNEWAPGDPAYRFTRSEGGTYSLTLSFEQGTTIEYRITRGSFTNMERYDQADRFANRILEVPEAATTVEITVESWWDQ